MMFVGNPGFEADISFWKSWSLAAADHGIVWMAHNTNINYPPAFSYVLYLMGIVYRIFADPHNFNQYWYNHNYLFLIIAKLPAILSDLAIGALIYIFFSRKKFPFLSDHFPPPLFLASLYLFNPVSILDGAIWGQVDSFGVLFTIVAVILLLNKKPGLASFIFIIGALTKLQNIIYIPVFYLFILRFYNFETLKKSIFWSFIAFLVGTFPFVLAKDLDTVLYLLTSNADWFPLMSLNAHNLWWIVAGGRGMDVSDKLLAMGIINAKTMGLILFSGVYLFVMFLVWIKPKPGNFILGLCLSVFGFFLFTTQSHERYSFPIVAFLPFLIPFLSHKKQKFTLFLYFFLSLAILYNINTGFALNYPTNALPVLSLFISIPATILSSILHIILFGTLFILAASEVSLFLPFIAAFFVMVAVSGKNFSYFVKKQIPLTSLWPTAAYQGYGSMQYNMSVNSYDKWKNWNFLSTQYYFYKKGIGTHANSTIIYDLNKNFSKFSTDYGIDTEAGAAASVYFKVYGDDKLLFTSPKVTKFDLPRHMEINIKGVKKLQLDVTDAGDGIKDDHADWLGPILYK